MSRLLSIYRLFLLFLLLLGTFAGYFARRECHQVTVADSTHPASPANSPAITSAHSELTSDVSSPIPHNPAIGPWKNAAVIAADRQEDAAGRMRHRRLLRTTFKYPLIVETTVANGKPDYYVADRLLLGPQVNASRSDLESLVSRCGGTLQAKDSYYVVTFAETGLQTVENSVTYFKAASDLVAYAEVDTLQYSHATTDDPHLSSQWHLTEIDAFSAWNTPTDTSSMVVAIIDSGIRTTHEDLRDNLWLNRGEVVPNGRDDDGNGYVDDLHGYDFYTNVASLTDADGHGTAMAGIIAARSANKLGIAGIAGRAKLMGVRFLDKEGYGSTSDAVESIEYAIKNHANLINASWGSGTYSQTLYNAVKKALDSGIVLVTSAGNDGNNIDKVPVYPACFDLNNIITVGSSSTTRSRNNYSNYGEKQVDLFAPEPVLSTSNENDESYSMIGGTSSAAAIVSGCVAYLKALHPALDAISIKQRILQFTRKTVPLQGFSVTGGIVNLNWSVRAKEAAEIVILSALHDISFYDNHPITLEIKATSSLPLIYTWYKDDIIIPEEKSARYFRPNFTVSDQGKYTVLVSNGESEVSSSATVQISLTPPFLQKDLDNVNVPKGEKVILSAIFGGSLPQTFRWYFNNQFLTVTPSAQLVIESANGEHVGSYYVTSTNGLHTAYSSTRRVDIYDQEMEDIRIVQSGHDWEYISTCEYSNGLYVGYGYDDILRISLDGIHWQKTSLNTNVKSVKWTESRKWIAMNSYGEIWQSSDAYLWQKLSLSSTFPVGSNIRIIAGEGEIAIQTETQLCIWPNDSNVISCFDVDYQSPISFFGGYYWKMSSELLSDETYAMNIYRSRNLVDWQFFSEYFHSPLKFIETELLITNGLFIYANRYSYDGKIWNTIKDFPSGNHFQLDSNYFVVSNQGNSRFLMKYSFSNGLYAEKLLVNKEIDHSWEAVGPDRLVAKSGVYYFDGREELRPQARKQNAIHTIIYFKNRIYDFQGNYIFSSTDGKVWNLVRGIQGYSSAQSTDTLVIVGKDRLYVTNDGKSFTPIHFQELPIPATVGGDPFGMIFSAIKREGNLFWLAATVSTNDSNSNNAEYIYYKSIDGFTWELQTWIHPHRVAYGAAGYLAVNGNDVFLSANGDDWSKTAHIPSLQDCYCYYFNNNYFIYDNFKNIFYISNNGIVWEEKPSFFPAHSPFEKFQSFNSKLFATTSSELFISDDGWNFRSFDKQYNLRSVVWTPWGWLATNTMNLFTWSSTFDQFTEAPDFAQPPPFKLPLYSSIDLEAKVNNAAAIRSVTLWVNDRAVFVDDTAPYTFTYVSEEISDLHFSLTVEEFSGQIYDSPVYTTVVTTGGVKEIGNSPDVEKYWFSGPVWCNDTLQYFYYGSSWSPLALLLTNDKVNYQYADVFDPKYPNEVWQLPTWYNGYFFSCSWSGRITVSSDGVNWNTTEWATGSPFTFIPFNTTMLALDWLGHCCHWIENSTWHYRGLSDKPGLYLDQIWNGTLYATIQNDFDRPDDYYSSTDGLHWKLEKSFPFKQQQKRFITSFNQKWFYANGYLLDNSGNCYSSPGTVNFIYSHEDIIGLSCLDQSPDGLGSGFKLGIDGQNWVHFYLHGNPEHGILRTNQYQSGKRWLFYHSAEYGKGTFYELLLHNLKMLSVSAKITGFAPNRQIFTNLKYRNIGIINIGGVTHPIKIQAELLSESGISVYIWPDLLQEDLLNRSECRSLDFTLDLPNDLRVGSYRLRLTLKSHPEETDFDPSDNSIDSEIFTYSPYVDCRIQVVGNGLVERSVSAPYWPDTQLELIALPENGNQFTGWRTRLDEETKTINPLSMVLSEDMIIEVGFAPDIATEALVGLHYDSDGWHQQSSIGQLFPDYFPWIFHREHGWWFMEPIGNTSWFIYDPTFSWLWTNSQSYPFLYCYTLQEWLYYWPNTIHPRYFYQTVSRQWLLIE